MRRTWTIIGIALLSSLLVFGAMGCKKRVPTTPTGTTNFVGVAPAQTEIPEPDALVAELKPVGTSQAAGKATFAKGDSGVGSKITVEMTGLPAGAHLNYIYHNNCNGEGEKHGPLTALNAEIGRAHV